MSTKPRRKHAIEDKENISPKEEPIVYPEEREELKAEESIQRIIVKEERDTYALKIAVRDRKFQDRTRLKLTEIPKPQPRIIANAKKESKENDKIEDELSKLLIEKARIFDEIDNFELAVEEPKKKRNNLLNSSDPQPLHTKLSKQVEVFEANIKVPNKELLTKKNDEFIAKMKNSSQENIVLDEPKRSRKSHTEKGSKPKFRVSISPPRMINEKKNLSTDEQAKEKIDH